MSEQRDLFPSPVQADRAELKAHAALYAAREEAEAAGPREPVVVTAPPRTIPQGGAEAARAVRERLREEHRAVVVKAAERFGRHGTIPTASVFRVRISDLPRLGRPGQEKPGPERSGSGT